MGSVNGTPAMFTAPSESPLGCRRPSDSRTAQEKGEDIVVLRVDPCLVFIRAKHIVETHRIPRCDKSNSNTHPSFTELTENDSPIIPGTEFAMSKRSGSLKPVPRHPSQAKKSVGHSKFSATSQLRTSPELMENTSSPPVRYPNWLVPPW